jgi:hypothetical protein
MAGQWELGLEAGSHRETNWATVSWGCATTDKQRQDVGREFAIFIKDHEEVLECCHSLYSRLCFFLGLNRIE